jgi:hypothetical protein
MGFKVVRDFYAERERKEGRKESEIDEVKKETEDYGDGNIRVKVYDDDGILYYEAKCDDDDDKSAERFHNWATWHSGTTGSKMKNPNTGKWEWFIC